MLWLREAHHRVRLAATGLAVGENGAVVAADDRLDEREGRLIVDLSLSGVNAIDRIISKNFLLWATLFTRSHDHLVRRLVDIAYTLAA